MKSLRIFSVNLEVVILALMALICIASPALATEKRNLVLSLGESKVVNVEFRISKVATGAPGICDVTRTGDNQILVNATGLGETNILIWDEESVRQELVIKVKMRDSDGVANELRQMFKEVEGVEVRAIGNSVAVEGEVFSKKDLDRVNLVMEGMSGVKNLVKMSPLLREILTKEIQKAIGIKGVRVVNAKDSFIIEGKVDNDAELIRAEKIASAYADDIINVITVRQKEEKRIGADKMVQLTLNIMEIEKGTLKDLGFHWNPGASGTATGIATEGDFIGVATGTISNLFPKMNRIRENGKGRSLFQQSIVTKSGNKANFFAGDEVPIPVAQEGGLMSVEYKRVGLTLEILPVIDALGNVDVNVHVDSSFVTGEGLGGAPRISDTKINSAVYLQSLESIALGGLIGQREARTLSNSPTTGEALVQLNNASRFQLEKSQVLVFVTPQILNSNREAVKEMSGEIKDSFKQYERDNLLPPKKAKNK